VFKLNRGISAIIMIVIVVFLLAGAFCFFSILMRTQGKYPVITIEKKIEPPPEAVSVYKGFWMPCLFMNDSGQSMSGVQDLKDVGANIIAFGPTIKINAEGKTDFGLSDELLEKRLAELVKRYYDAGTANLYTTSFPPRPACGGARRLPKF